MMVSDRVTYGPDGTALVTDRATILGSVMRITADRAATGCPSTGSDPFALIPALNPEIRHRSNKRARDPNTLRASALSTPRRGRDLQR
jgi:hypothetical protein